MRSLHAPFPRICWVCYQTYAVIGRKNPCLTPSRNFPLPYPRIWNLPTYPKTTASFLREPILSQVYTWRSLPSTTSNLVLIHHLPTNPRLINLLITASQRVHLSSSLPHLLHKACLKSLHRTRPRWSLSQSPDRNRNASQPHHPWFARRHLLLRRLRLHSKIF